jgi:hypothetical protein
MVCDEVAHHQLLALYSFSQSCLDIKPEDELRREASQLVFWFSNGGAKRRHYCFGFYRPNRRVLKLSTFFQMIGKIAIFRYTLLALLQAKLKVKTFTGIVFHFANECILIGKTL